ncbi:hypothetical protein COV19_01555 [Candidatus Woesearchaeota archaeon CG10_big_fil_rev_8_21_14_0_10_44_13]|nr:MAG: hypothetical protein COV19_01555 [Candidatus Woesearchaeota archaeon CG10_big_fil_rev_8_21_14_0_10_44_13]
MKKKFLWALMSLLMLFGIISLVTFLSLQDKQGILGIMPYYYEDLIVIGFCILSSAKVVWEIHKL